MDEQASIESNENRAKERLKRLALAGGETMFQAICYTAGALLVTLLADSIRDRSNKEQ